MNKVVYTIYARYSSDLQNPKSAEDQITDIRIDIKNRFPTWQWYGKNFKDESKRGGSVTGRDGFIEMVGRASQTNPPFNVIVVESTSRWARNRAESIKYREQLREFGVEVLSKSNNYLSPYSKIGKMLYGLNELMDEVSNDEKGEMVRRGMCANIRRGRSAGGAAPYGYRRVPVEAGTNKDGSVRYDGIVFKVNNEEAENVRKIYKLYASGEFGVAALTRHINRKLRWKNRSGKPFIWTFIRCVLVNPRYKGLIYYNTTQEVKLPDGRRVKKKNPKEQWVLTVDKKLAIVDEKTWSRAQKVREERAKRCNSYSRGRKTGNERHPYVKYLLSSLIKCECGRNMQVRPSVGKELYYVCPGRTKDGVCDNWVIIRRVQLERDVMSVVEEEMFSEKGRRYFIQSVQKALGELFKGGKSNMGSLERERRGLDKKIGNLVQAIEAGANIQEVVERLKSYQARRNQVDQELVVLEQVKSVKLGKDLTKQIREAYNYAKEVISEGGTARLRELLKKHIDHILVRKNGKVSIRTTATGFFEGVLLNLIGRGDWI